MYGGNIVDFTEIYDFEPVISVSDFLKINKNLNSKKDRGILNKIHNYQENKAKLLNGMVHCASCGVKMSAGITVKKTGKRYYYFRCNNKHCEYHNKSVRAKVVIDFVLEFLEKHPFSNKETYKHYRDEMKRLNKLAINEYKESIKLLKNEKKGIEKKISNIENSFGEIEEKVFKRKQEKRYVELTKELERIELELKRKKQEVNNLEKVILTYDEFIELWNTMPEYIKGISDLELLDKVIRNIFSNFFVSRKKVEKYRLSNPFSKFYVETSEKVPECGDGGIWSPLLSSLRSFHSLAH